MAARRIDQPSVGHFLLRLVPGGPEVPACICYESDARGERIMAAYICNERVSVDAVWLQRSRPIDQAEYVYRLKIFDYAVKHEPNSPAANPREKIDLNNQPSIF